ncbi:Uu.00g024300.m01.CDS01 [Anthostomella pinea]|uniref:Uu.00g024300.m01.CDS01 n=1 Tax=Anthostomella pinea TaxID=933095 RepID=A0AAI8W074_9PEZI|nr:Uu.00g024300.m01.CDS01 [Anthostomella pinea]
MKILTHREGRQGVWEYRVERKDGTKLSVTEGGVEERDKKALSEYKNQHKELQDVKDLYLKRASAAILNAHKILTSLRDEAKPRSRMNIEAGDYLVAINSCTVGQPVTAAYYTHINNRKWNKPTDNFVFCSSRDAEEILKRGPPLLPNVIPIDWNNDAKHSLNISEFLEQLTIGPMLEFHGFERELPQQGYVTPVKLDSKLAIDKFKDDARGPLNFLNLRGRKPNQVPSCLARLPEYHIIGLGTENGKEGKPGGDLTRSIRFHLLASKGAIHSAHINRHGMITTIFNEEGDKLWPLWVRANVRDWAESRALPTGPLVGLLLAKGYTLIQPGGTIHMPCTIGERVLLSGTMHWHPRQVLQILQQTQVEIECPHVTNEPVSGQFLGEISLILRLWKANTPLFDWGSQEDLEECESILKRLQGMLCTIKKRKRGKAKAGEDIDSPLTLFVIPTAIVHLRNADFVTRSCRLAGGELVQLAQAFDGDQLPIRQRAQSFSMGHLQLC